jgi:hypothetical protein
VESRGAEPDRTAEDRQSFDSATGLCYYKVLPSFVPDVLPPAIT